MKYRYIILLFGLIFFLPQANYAQDELGVANKAFYVELGGNGLIFSLNFESRFSSRPDGFGGRVGIGFIGGVDDNNVITIPVMVNTLLGKNGSYFEVGAGITYIGGSADFLDDDDDLSDVVGTLSFMYRKQPVNGGFTWKVGITPIIADGVFFPYWVGIGLGYAF